MPALVREVTHWRHHRARDGMIYIQDASGKWHWVTPAYTRRSMHRLLCVIISIVAGLFMGAVLLLAFGCARVHAEGLPQYGVSCEDIVLMQQKFGIKDTVKGRVQARAIAAALGVWLTDEEIEEAARCLPPALKEKRR